jgi:hypothetical protein
MQINVLSELRQSIGAVSVVDFDEETVRFDDLELNGVSGSVSMPERTAGCW